MSQPKPGQPGWAFHKFEGMSLGVTVQWGNFFDDYTFQRKIRFLWVAVMFGPWQVSYRFVTRRFGIRGVA